MKFRMKFTQTFRMKLHCWLPRLVLMALLGVGSAPAAAQDAPQQAAVPHSSWALAGAAAVVVVGGIGSAAGAGAGVGLAYLGCPVLGCSTMTNAVAFAGPLGAAGSTDWMFFGSAAAFGAIIGGGVMTSATASSLMLMGLE